MPFNLLHRNKIRKKTYARFKKFIIIFLAYSRTRARAGKFQTPGIN